MIISESGCQSVNQSVKNLWVSKTNTVVVVLSKNDDKSKQRTIDNIRD